MVRFELNRSISGMGHERYASIDDADGDRPVDRIARRLFEAGGIDRVHINSNVITLDINTLAGEIEKSASSHKASDLWTRAGDMLRGKLPKAVSLLDAEASVPPTYGTSKYPETYLIDPQGKVTTWFIGPKAWGHPKSVEFIRNATKPTKPGS